MDSAFYYVMNNGLETEEDYVYHGKDGKKCKYKKEKVVLDVSSYEDVKPESVEQLKIAVA